MARPIRIFTDKELQDVERYARIGCYDKTISVGLGIPETTLKRSLGAKIRNWRALGKLDMRDNLHKQADSSPQTAIFIAKNELGMSDKQVVETVQAESKPLSKRAIKAHEAASKRFNEVMSRAEAEPAVIKLTGKQGA